MLEDHFNGECCVIHSNKTQNYRLRSVENFEIGKHRILIATDVMARGLDIDDISHVINFDTPNYPENYMHRIGRTGRAEKQGHSITFSTEKELEAIQTIQDYMDLQIPLISFPQNVAISKDLIEEEQPQIREPNNPIKRKKASIGEAFHEKKDKNKKENLGGSYRREIAKKYKKPKTRGDKNFNRRNKKK